MRIAFKQRLNTMFRQSRWLRPLVGALFFVLCFAVQAEMVRILPPSP